MNNKKIKIVFIIGSGRSGTTLLDRILGQYPKAFSVGELNFIWRNSFIENQLCGCGKNFKECEVWNSIIKFATECIEFDVEKLDNLQNKYANTLKFIIGRRFFKKEEIQYLVDAYECIYEGIKKYGNYEIIIDSSKNIPHFYYLMKYGKKINPYVIHIVRNPKAVAYSWVRKKIKPDTGKPEEMPRYSIINSSLRWLIKNYLSEHYFKNSNYIRIKYEDLVKDPVSTLNTIFDFIGLNKDFIRDFVSNENVITLNINHTVSGNPMRFKVGKIKIEEDNEWIDKLGFFRKSLVNLFTYPLLKKYYCQNT